MEFFDAESGTDSLSLPVFLLTESAFTTKAINLLKVKYNVKKAEDDSRQSKRIQDSGSNRPGDFQEVYSISRR